MLLLPGWDFHGTLSLCADLDDFPTRRSWVLSICVDNFSDQRHSDALHYVLVVFQIVDLFWVMPKVFLCE